MNKIVILLDKANSKRRKDDNGYLIVEKNPIAFSGVYPYLLSEVDENSKSDDIVSVYRPFDDLLQNKDKFKNKPIIWQHHWTGEQGDNQKADGAIFGDIEAKENGLFADLIIYNKDLIKAIEKGECYELSPGYEAEVIAEQGTHENQPYSYKQKLLNVNHLAVVERGRTGHDLRIQDEKTNQKQGAEKMTLKAFWENFKKFGDAEIAKGETDETIETTDEVITTEPAQTIKTDKDKDLLVVDDEVVELTDSDEIEVLDEDEEIIVDSECGGDTAQIKDEFTKVVNKLVDERLNAYRVVDEAILEVKRACGNFNSSKIKTADEAYAVGYKMLTKAELPKGYDSKTAFNMAKSQVAGVTAKVTDSKAEPSVVDRILSNF